MQCRDVTKYIDVLHLSKSQFILIAKFKGHYIIIILKAPFILETLVRVSKNKVTVKTVENISNKLTENKRLKK